MTSGHAASLNLPNCAAMTAGHGNHLGRNFAHDSIMFDDSLDVQKTLRGAGIRVIDPVQFNTYIARKIA